MNRTIKEATVKRYHYNSHEQLKTHLSDFINAYNYARRLKTLKGLTPYEFIVKAWTKEPEQFKLDPKPSNAGTKHNILQPMGCRLRNPPSNRIPATLAM